MAEREVKLKFTADGAERVSSAIQKIGSTSQRSAQQATTLARAGQRVTASLSRTSQVLLQLPTALVNTGRLLRATTVGLVRSVGSFLAQADAVIDARSAFAGYTRQLGGAAAVLRDLEEATANEISALQLQQNALLFAAGGAKLDREQLALLFRGIKQITDATGQEFVPILKTVARAFSGLTISTLAQSLGIENLSQKQLAAKIGVENLTGRLSAQQFTSAALILIQERLAEVTDIFGKSTENLGDAAARARKDFQDFTADFSAAFATSESLSSSLAGLGVVLATAGNEGETAGTKIGNAFADAAAFVVKAFQGIALAVKGFIVLSQAGISQLARGLAATLGFLQEQLGVEGTLVLDSLRDAQKGFADESERGFRAIENQLVAIDELRLSAERGRTERPDPTDPVVRIEVGRDRIERVAERAGDEARIRVIDEVRNLLQDAEIADAAAATAP